MASGVFIATIDLSESQYYFSGRTTFFQAFFSLLSIIFLSIDTAIEDIIGKIAYSLREKAEKVGVFLVGGLMPKTACA